MGKQPAVSSRRKPSASNFLELIRDDVIAHLQGMGGQISGENITKIICPSCGKPEAWTKLADPSTIICNRKNQCRVNTHYKDFASHLWGNWVERFPASKKDPHRTARIYLQSRGLDTNNFEFEQGYWKEDGWAVATVAFKCNWTNRRWHRLIDPPAGVGKTRWDLGDGDAYRGQAWTRGLIDPKRELCITESPIEALSLYQAGIQTVASFSAHHVPYSFFQEHRDRDKQIFIALNSDEAGISGTLKNLRTLTDLGFSNVRVAQPPPGLDWNDLLVAGAFDEKNKKQTFDESIWRGDLLLSGSAKEYWQIYRKRYPKLKTHIFSWDANTWIGTAKDKDDSPELGVERIADCEIRLLYSLKDTTNQQRSKETFLLETCSRREGRKQVRMTAAELSKPSELTSTLLETTRQIFRLQPVHFPTFGAYLLRSNPPSIRVLQHTGYDEESGCFVYPNFAFDRTGKLHTLNGQGYFDQLKIIPAPDSNAIKLPPDPKADVAAILKEHWQAFGLNGTLALGFQVATSFSHVTFPILGYHPI
ncbi:MAG: toprim domain-containing protein, partial [Deltaproteobacteria bacterium]